MLSSTIAKAILNCLVNQGNTTGASGSNTSLSISMTNAKLALFTTMPNEQGNGAVEVSLDGYARKPLWGVGISGDAQFDTSAAWDATENMYSISNTDEIQMHAISEDETGEAIVLGFGIYTGADTGTKVLQAWGKLLDENGNETTVTLKAGSVPVFYTGKFKLMLG